MLKQTTIPGSTIKFSILCLLALAFFGCSQRTTITSANTSSDLEILDTNKDGIIDPYEALDRLLVLKKENGKAASIKDIKEFAVQENKEMEEMFSEFDTNRDGKIVLEEVDEEMLDFVQVFDSDNNGEINISGLMELDITGSILASEEEIQDDIKDIFQELDTNKDNIIDMAAEVSAERQDSITEWDYSRDKRVTREEAYNYMKANNTPVTFTVKGDTAYMTGVITAGLPAEVLRLIFEHPEVKIIEMLIVPGSIDDVANIRAALYVHQHGMTTKLNSNSAVASGGTDFFMAGTTRIVEKGATLGVHSWGGGDNAPKDHPEHQKYIDFYNIVGIPESFYWYTMEAASSNSIHIMTEEEIATYKVRRKNPEVQ